ncbi:WD40 repeat-containing protein [Cavenderia fasciculata]|uniref:WD40 repeat-containing protein n=1 Tax=Cavenderia fasciculata TaxID=261658 RepID=F4PJG5_CACFS|nr:WD40 repeat-containing protein [Cavenderia fasciculata]EGG24451.1 WD40 repeat-containing protein [Cavenderia fasciculata]|eukprot:XP_004362302.1 WD40 repeat-containing protein [Cavenderia fasciculata]
MNNKPTKKDYPRRKAGFKAAEEVPSTLEQAEKIYQEEQSLSVIIQFKNKDDQESEPTGPPISVPQNITTEQLQLLINNLLKNDEELPYSFFVDENEIVKSLKNHMQGQSEETTLNILYQPQAVFRITPVTRCSSSMEGHTEAVLNSAFSPDGSGLASVGGDGTLRIWDLNTQTPIFTCKGHTNWVLQVSWSPDGKKIATGGMEGEIRIWNPKTGKQMGSVLRGHTKFITALQWEPYHLNPNCTRLASSSKDATVKIWDTESNKCLMTLSGHTMSVTCLRWSGEGLIYSGSQDRTIRVFNTNEGRLIRALEGHAHWVNSIALNTDYVLRTGPFDHTGKHHDTKEEAQKAALERYNQVLNSVAGGTKGDVMVSGSDDFTCIVWNPAHAKAPVARLAGHQQLINLVSFSPNGRYFASASFDKSIKLWDAANNKFLGNFRGHVGAVYQVCWSSDSRYLVSGSKDSTLKIWDIKTKKMTIELPGHADEVYTVDWSPDGQSVVSGSKDRLLKIWRN